MVVFISDVLKIKLRNKENLERLIKLLEIIDIFKHDMARIEYENNYPITACKRNLQVCAYMQNVIPYRSITGKWEKI